MSKKLLRFLTVTMFVLGAVLFGKVAISATTGVGDTFVATCPVRATGVITSWNSTRAQVFDGTLLDDGYYQMGITMPDRNADGTLDATDRFEDLGDGTVKDHLTGLNWMKDANKAGGAKTWANALSYVTNFNTAGTAEFATNLTGKNDWRLPTIKELQSLAGYGTIYSHGNTIAVANDASSVFANIQATVPYDIATGLANNNFYWSSTTDAGGTANAWGQSFYIAASDSGAKTVTGYVWMVRNAD